MRVIDVSPGLPGLLEALAALTEDERLDVWHRMATTDLTPAAREALIQKALEIPRLRPRRTDGD